MHTKLWVYIYEDQQGSLIIALATSCGAILINGPLKLPIVYLRPFDIPFDALAHKLLLETLSGESVRDWINRHKLETEVWLSVCVNG